MTAELTGVQIHYLPPPPEWMLKETYELNNKLFNLCAGIPEFRKIVLPVFYRNQENPTATLIRDLRNSYTYHEYVPKKGVVMDGKAYPKWIFTDRHNPGNKMSWNGLMRFRADRYDLLNDNWDTYQVLRRLRQGWFCVEESRFGRGKNMTHGYKGDYKETPLTYTDPNTDKVIRIPNTMERQETAFKKSERKYLQKRLEYGIESGMCVAGTGKVYQNKMKEWAKLLSHIRDVQRPDSRQQLFCSIETLAEHFIKKKYKSDEAFMSILRAEGNLNCRTEGDGHNSPNMLPRLAYYQSYADTRYGQDKHNRGDWNAQPLAYFHHGIV